MFFCKAFLLLLFAFANFCWATDIDFDVRSKCPDDDDDKIVGGYMTCPGQFPWVLGLWRKNGLGPFCGASLVTHRWALTAAHCVYSKNHRGLKVVVGDFDTKKKEDGEQHREICGKKIHHGYTGGVDHDIALLELCKPVEFTFRVQPVGLAPKKANRDGKAKNATVAGWGTLRESGTTSRYLRAVVVPIVDTATCNKAYGFIKKGHICAGRHGKDSCQGDSGGPMWWKEESTERLLQVGIVSVGNGCARKGYPGVYTRVSEYHSWILDTMAQSLKYIDVQVPNLL